MKHLSSHEIATILHDYYGSLNQGSGSNARLLGWENQTAQERRFGVFASLANPAGKKILDVGAGLGDLEQFLQNLGIVCDYHGTELYGPFYHKLVHRFDRDRIRQVDVFSDPGAYPPECFDAVYCSGPFNLSKYASREFLHHGYNALCALTKATVTVSLLDYRSPTPESTYAYFNPDEVKEMLWRPDFEITLVEGYLPNDFTIHATRLDSD